MNGVHDMGGMHGMGSIQPEENEPVFHHRWEARVFAVVRAMGAFGRWNIDASRHQRELIPAAEQLRMSYYERWLAGLSQLLVRHGFLSTQELATGKPVPGPMMLAPALPADKVPGFIAGGSPAARTSNSPPRFRPGQRVRARNLNPIGHTRLPRYVRGKAGMVDRVHGVFVFPDTNAHLRGESPQHVYSVRFEAQELWGDVAVPRDAVYVDLWEGYLDAL
ncbi:MAG: nitrile hydratase subunit beta [Gammaproteobacteria bacterium]|nr:nitrile hydratase subunit beta [Gammaproteobacteria bacterium]MDE2262199.1 nitrile hydratase subunit beta [Gammaproteobacteria bacterium]